MTSISDINKGHRSVNEDLPEHILALKDQLINILLVIFVFLGIPGLVPALAQSLEVGFQPPMLVDIFSFLISLIVVLWHRHISYKIRATALLIAMFGLAFSGLITWGLIGMGIILLMTCTVLSTLLFDNRTGWFILIISTFTIALVSWSIRTGWVKFPIDFSAYTVESSTWAFAINMFVMLTGMLTYFVTKINATLLEAYKTLEGRTLELRRHVHHLETLREIEKGIQVARSPQAIAQIAVDRLRQIVPSRGICITLFDFPAKDPYVLAAGTDFKTRIAQGACLPLTAFKNVIEGFQKGKTHVILKTREMGILEKQFIGEGAFDSVAYFPLHFHENLMGSLDVYFDTNENEISTHNSMLRQVADQLAIAIQQARLDEQIKHHAEELEQQVTNRTRELFILYEFSSAASNALDKQAFIESALRITLKILEFSGGCIQLLNDKEQTLTVAASCGLLDEIEKIFNVRCSDDSLTNKIFSNKERLIMTDFKNDGSLPASLRAAGYEIYIGAPILVDGKCEGILSLFDKAQRLSIEEIKKMLSTIMDQIVSGIKTTLLRQEVRKAAIIAERGRVARDIHDSITQQLYSLVLFSYAAQTYSKTQDTQSLERILDELIGASQQALQEMRLMIFELLPSVLDQTDLIEAIQHRLEIVEQRAGISVCITAPDNLKINTEIKENAYLIIQEALNNVVKHARATQVSVHIVKQEETLEIRVSDNGCGFEIHAIRLGIGLASMKERAKNLGGDFNIISTPGNGTIITISLPYRADYLEDQK